MKNGWLILPDGRVAAGNQMCVDPAALAGLLQRGVTIRDVHCKVRRITEHTVWLEESEASEDSGKRRP